MKGYIYNLKEKGDVFYIGSTVNPYTRLQTHNNNMKCFGGKHQICMPKKHFKSVEMEIIEEVEFDNYKELRYLECYWIHQFIAWGFELTNKNYQR